MRASGNCGPIFNIRRQVTGFRLLTPGINQVKVIQPAGGDPFSLKVQPITDLLKFAPLDSPGHRVRVRGIVTLQWPGQWLFLKDATGGLAVPTSGTVPVSVGQQVDAAGFAEPNKYSPALQDAIFRPIGEVVKIAPAEVTAKQALSGDYDASLVKLRGKLHSQLLQGGEEILELAADGIVYRAVLPERLGGGELRAVNDGSTVELTGIALVKVSEDRHTPKEFQLLLRSPKDLIVLAKPKLVDGDARAICSWVHGGGHFGSAFVGGGAAETRAPTNGHDPGPTGGSGVSESGGREQRAGQRASFWRI